MKSHIQRLLTKPQAQGLVDEINQGAVDVRENLMRLRNGEGWRPLGFKNWDDCVETVFVFSRRHANRQLVAAEIEQRVRPIGPTSNGHFLLPESHARELAFVPVDKQLEVYRRALQTSPNGLTAKHIARTIAAMGIRKTRSIFDEYPTGPTTRRHASSGTHCTPVGFHSALEGRFGPIAIDLAASKSNAIVPRFFSREQNSLKQDWVKALRGGIGYLNPPFDPMAPWSDKSEMESQNGAKLLVMGQASVGADWFWQMFPLCATYVPTPRLIFIGYKSAFPRDLILCAFNLVGDGVRKSEVGRITRWHWQRENDQRLVRTF